MRSTQRLYISYTTEVCSEVLIHSVSLSSYFLLFVLFILFYFTADEASLNADIGGAGGAQKKFHMLHNPKVVQEYLFTSRDMLVYFVKVLWLHKQYKEVVELGSRIVNIYIKKGVEFCKPVGQALMPLVIHAQVSLNNLLSHFASVLCRLQRHISS